MTPSDVELAGKLLAMHTERSVILANLRQHTQDCIHVMSVCSPEATDVVNAAIDASPEPFDVSDHIKAVVYDMIEKQLIDELDVIEADLSGLGVPMAFRAIGSV